MSRACPAIILAVASAIRRASAGDRRFLRVGPDAENPRRLEEALLGERQQGVTDDHRLADAEQGPHRGAVTAFRVVIDDVVMDQREVVDELDRHGTRDPELRRHADRLGGQHSERWTYPFAAVVRDDAALSITPAEVVLSDRTDLGRQRRHSTVERRRDDLPRALEDLLRAPRRRHTNTSVVRVVAPIGAKER